MIRIENHLGRIELAQGYLSSLIGHAATGCYGVLRMNPAGAKQGVKKTLLKSDAISNGVRVIIPKNTSEMTIELHITVSYGINVAAITDSIMNKVRYVVESETGVKVKRVNVFVDKMENAPDDN